MRKRTLRSRAFRAIGWALVHGQVLLGLPTVAQAAPAGVQRSQPMLADAPAAPSPSGKGVTVNRRLPKVTPPPSRPVFSSTPTEAEIFRARVFEEPIVPVGGTPSPEENLALARVLTAYLAGGGSGTTAPIEAILEAHALSPYRASLLLNLGGVYISAGRPTRALRAFKEAWALAKTATDVRGRAVADKAAGQLARLLARVGSVSELREILAEVEGRDVGGAAGQMLQQGREGAELMATQPGSSFRCGPLALDRLLGRGKSDYQTDLRLAAYSPSHLGTTLDELQVLAQQLGQSFQMAKRVDRSAKVVIPAVVHWALGHFAALVEERDGKYLLEDAVFGGELWISRDAFDDEMSGYALVGKGELPPGWREVAVDEARRVWGRGPTSGGNTENYGPGNHCSGGSGSCCGGPGGGGPGGGGPPMARYTVDSMLVSLAIEDTPVGYTPSKGPAIGFTVRYNQRESFQPQIFSYWNLGPLWTSHWLGYVTDDPANGSQPATVYQRGGGQETYTGYAPGTGSYGVHYRTRAQLVRVSSSPILYQRRLPDGSFEEYALPDGAASSPRKVFLTRVVNAQGDAVSLTYDSTLRLVALSDAVGQVTTLSYDLPSDPLKVTKVTDPFGRFALFEYDAVHLVKITDTIGIQSQFEYGTADFVTALTTPYGRTAFATGAQGTDRFVEATDALGAVERVEYRNDTPAVANELVVPQGFSNNPYLHYRNTFYWDKRASAEGQGDYSKAQILHWLHTPDGTKTAGTLESEKKPLENRVWYSYPGQAQLWREGTSTTPTAIARVLDDGSTQAHQYEYNARGRTTKTTDPLGRETVYVYGINNTPDANPTTGEGIDLLQVKQKNGSNYDILQSYTYNDKHQPLTITDARGATTTYTYNAVGQVLTVTTPPALDHGQGATTTFTYDTDGRLTQVSGPVPGASTTFTYDAHGRKRTSTDATGLTLIYDHDALDRVTKVTYPDTTYEETVYKWLDAGKRRDRLGRWTHTFHDALRRPVATRDAAGGTTTYQYGGSGCSSCAGGGDKLTKLIDANGNATSWDNDLQGRVTQETRADLSSERYTYETTSSRLKQKTDRKGVTTTFEYFLDGKLKRKSYSDTTPAVNYTYDPVAGQMLTAANGTDTLTWTYDNMDRVATEASTKNASTVGYTYDDAGNRTVLSLDGATHVSYGYDQQSRLTSITRGANVFAFGYDTPSRRTSMSYPNGVVTTYGYDAESRLTSLAASLGATPITSFGYVLDAAGNRTQKTTLDWAEDYRYDDVYRLVSADRSAGTPSRWRFAYDAAGNRTGDQTDEAAMGASHNNLNQLLTREPGGVLAFKGTTNEPASVDVGGKAVQTASDNSFAAQAPVGAGTTDVAVTATDPSGNVRTNTYRVSASGAGATYTYDPNGNLATKTEGSDTWAYTWNAENQLTKVEKNDVDQARFAYDPIGRRVEKVAGGVTTSYTYDDESILRELRGGATLKYVHGPAIDEPLAVDDGATLTQFHVDGLGSIVRATNAAGAVILTREYDAWGNHEVGASEPGYAFTGREWDRETGFYYYRARYYDAKMGRFISADPIRFLGGVNFYAYVINNPTGHVDPFGLQWWNPKKYWDAWKQYEKHKKCVQTVIECDKRVECKCSGQKSETDRSVCQTPASTCCAKVAILCEGGFSFNVDNCAPPCPPDPSPTPPPPPNPCNVFGQNSKQCRDWWEDWKRKNGGEW